MGFKVDDLSDEELGKVFRLRFQKLVEAHKAGLIDTHPAKQWNADGAILRAARDNGGLGPKELEPTGDDPPPSSRAPGTPPLPERKGGSLQRGQDSAPQLRLPRVTGDGRIQHEIAVDEDLIVTVTRRR